MHSQTQIHKLHVYNQEKLGNLAAEPMAGVKMETPEDETTGVNSRNLKLPTQRERWNLGRFLFSAQIVPLSSDVLAVSFLLPPPTLPLSVCMHLWRVLAVVTMIIDSVLCVYMRVCVWLHVCVF